MEKKSDVFTKSTRSFAYLNSRRAGSKSGTFFGGSPRRARTLSTPRRRYSLRSASMDVLVAPMQVRCDMTVRSVSFLIHLRLFIVLSCVVPPAPYVTETDWGS